MNPLQTGMFPQSQMDKTQFATPTQMPVSREIVSSDFDTQVNPYTGNLPRFDKGGHVGLKSLAGDLAQYGRGGDTMVAHINPQEAAMLKAMGGSGTINPTTGLPEFLSLGGLNPVKALGGLNLGSLNPLNPGSGINKSINSIPVIGDVNKKFSDLNVAIMKPVDQALVGLDKTVGKAIPGGWGTVAQVAARFVPVIGPALSVGIGALNGSGVLRKGGKFNMQGALMGGAVAYGMGQLSDYVSGANLNGTTVPTPTVDVPAVPAPDAISSLNASQGWTGPTATDLSSSIPQGSINAANAAGDIASRINPATNLPYGSALGDTLAGNAPVTPSIGSQIMNGEFGNAATQFGDNVSQGIKNAYNSASDFADKATTGSTYTDALSKGIDNAKTFSGGLSDLATSPKDALAQADKMAAINGTMAPGKALLLTGAGAMGLSNLEAQRNYEKEMNSANNAANAEWNNIMAGVEQRRKRSEDAVRAHPYQFSSGGSMPRFLSGGGDGLSDDIPATIEGKQPARLADGEFVVSADVVSGLGGGSSKAGAKKLYSMMDRIRKQAYGTKKQVRKVSNRALPA